ncbi:MAG: hypothetical protein QOC92_378 [Acidimicrobiaceae bacterium]|jgi:hypothetical protein
MKIRYLVGIGALAGTMFAGGQAFTASNDVPAASVVKGYGSQTITGVTATSITYNTNTAGDTIESVGLVLNSNTTARVIKIAFNDEAPATCSDAAPVYGVTSSYTCLVDQAVATANKFALVAS